MAVASILLVATAFGLTIWRYELAQESGRAALVEGADRLSSERAATVFWHEREAINEYLLTGRADVLVEIDSLRTEFVALTESLNEDNWNQRRNVANTRVANDRFLQVFEGHRRLDLTDRGAQLEAIQALRPYEEAVLRPLRILNALELKSGQEESRDAASASGQARRVALLGAILALGSGLGFALYAFRLLRKGTRQARALEQTLAQRELAQERLREREHELRQAQKMEAVGRLAGGVAHDFNNILQAITGYSDLASADVRPDQPELRDSIDRVKAAATLATALTGKLLAFSRQEVVEPREMDMTVVVEELTGMLRPLLGREVELVLELESSCTSVKADPGQLEQVVMNLVINARDAMPEGGRVTITVDTLDLTNPNGSLRVPPGRYVRLAVADNGMGMDEATVSSAFDPFFTTKEEGKGTGLGLATVYGIVTQSGGDVKIKSAPGEGTTFNVYLPCIDDVDEPAAPERSPQPALGGRAILAA